MRNILVDIKSYKDGDIVRKETNIEVTSNARNIIFENEVYHLIGIDGPDYEYHSRKSVLKVGVDEIDNNLISV